jgi:hypothetical protein
MIRQFVIVAVFDDKGDLDTNLPDEELVAEALGTGAADDALGDVAGCPVTLHCVGEFPENCGADQGLTLFEPPGDEEQAAYAQETDDSAQPRDRYS